MEQNTNKVGKHSAPQQVQGESFFRRLLKKPGVQSFLAALLCIVIGLVVGYIVLLAIEPSGASKAIGSGAEKLPCKAKQCIADEAVCKHAR